MLDGRAHVSLRSYAHTDTTHAHDWHQLVLPVTGAHTVALGNVSGTVESGRGVLVVSGLSHCFRGLGENCFVVLDIPREARRSQGLPEAVWRPALAQPFFTIDDGLNRFANYVAHEMKDGALDAATEHHVVNLLIHTLTRRLDARRTAPTVTRAVELIHAHYAQPYSVAELAAAVGLSSSTLHERFRAAMECGPGEYAMNVRLDHAERLLRASDLSIAEIAVATGFSDQSALTRSLRRRRGTTPARFRLQ